MSIGPLRIEQYETVSYDTNMNPLGIPASVKQSISGSLDAIRQEPDTYYGKLRDTIASYAGTSSDRIVTGNSTLDLLRLFTALVSPKKALVPVPSADVYTRVLSEYGCEVTTYTLSEENEFRLDPDDLIRRLDSSLDMLILGNPSNPTSKKITRADISEIAEACSALDIFLVVDEMYVEFLDDWDKVTAVPLTDEFENLAVIRSTSKFFAVPGLSVAYAILRNPVYRQIIEQTENRKAVSSLSAIAVTAMLKDEKYISESRSMVHTERSLIYLAMSTSRAIRLYKPEANFMLVRLLNPDISSRTVAEHCRQYGIMIRRCDDIPGLGDRYIRFCFMKPKQNDLAVNTILEICEKE